MKLDFMTNATNSFIYKNISELKSPCNFEIYIFIHIEHLCYMALMYFSIDIFCDESNYRSLDQ